MLSTNKKMLLPLIFFLFILFIIYKADMADHNFAFRLIGNIPYGDKFMHGLLYGVMAMFLNYGLSYKSIKYKFNIPLGATYVMIFASIEEFSQIFISSRTFDLLDLFSDLVGVILFSYIRYSK